MAIVTPMHSNGGWSTVSSPYFASNYVVVRLEELLPHLLIRSIRSSTCVIRMPTSCFRLCITYTLWSAFVGYHSALIRGSFYSRPYAHGAFFVPKPGFSM
jgi:hypothetical protein